MIGHSLQNVRAGEDKLVSRRLELPAPTLRVTSRAFEAGGALPTSSTADGAGVPPVLEWSEVPPTTRSVVVVCEDPDAPFPQPFVHWLLYRILPHEHTTGAVPTLRGLEGKNSALSVGFTGAAPPPGHGAHRYHFQVFAVDTLLDLEAGAGRGAVVAKLRDHVVAWGEIVATYERS